MTFPPYILRLITLRTKGLWRLTLPGSATLLRHRGQKSVLGAIKSLLNAFRRGIELPLVGCREVLA